MKKNISNIIILMFLAIIINVKFLVGQTQVTRYTPLGSSVRAYNQISEMSSGDKEDWSDYVQTYFPLASEQNPHSATRSYNCHAYAWHVSQGQDKVWIGYYPGQEGDEDIYWTDGSYIRLNSESGADKISYYTDNHSAIQTATQGTYESKWGDGPLMRHTNNYGPSIYNMNYRYYYDAPVISGDKIICYPNTKTYSVQDFYNVTYLWSVSTNLQINGSNTSRSVSITPKSASNSSGFVRVSIYIPSYSRTDVVTADVIVGSPTPSISAVKISGEGEPTMYDFTATSLVGSTYNWYVNNSLNESSSYPNNTFDYYFPCNLSRTIKCNISNICGTSAFSNSITKTGECKDLAFISLSPNPANENVQITINNNSDVNSDTSAAISAPLITISKNEVPSYIIKIYDGFGTLCYSIEKQGNIFDISVGKLKNGIYIIQVINGKQSYNQQLIIKH